jgi:hypothetical protein
VAAGRVAAGLAAIAWPSVPARPLVGVAWRDGCSAALSERVTSHWGLARRRRAAGLKPPARPLFWDKGELRPHANAQAGLGVAGWTLRREPLVPVSYWPG